MKDSPLLSIIILNFNAMDFIEVCLRSILNSAYPRMEVIFVDNASTDGSVQLVKNKFGHDHRIRFVLNNKNYGFCAGNNIGSKHAQGKYLVFLNPDVKIFDSEWLNNLVKIMEGDQTTGIVHPVLLNWDSNVVQSAGIYMLWPHPIFTFDFGKNEDYKEFIKRHPKPYAVFSALGACMMIKKELFEDIGLFDSNFFMYGDEIDISWRTWIRGYKVVTVPSVTVHHYLGGTREKVQFKRFIPRYHAIKSMIRVMTKNFELKYLIPFLPIYVTSLLAEELLLAFKFKTPEPLVILMKALFWNLRNLANTLTERKKVQKIRRVPDNNYIIHIRKRIPLSDLVRRWHTLRI